MYVLRWRSIASSNAICSASSIAAAMRRAGFASMDQYQKCRRLRSNRSRWWSIHRNRKRADGIEQMMQQNISLDISICIVMRATRRRMTWSAIQIRLVNASVKNQIIKCATQEATPTQEAEAEYLPPMLTATLNYTRARGWIVQSHNHASETEWWRERKDNTPWRHRSCNIVITTTVGRTHHTPNYQQQKKYVIVAYLLMFASRKAHQVSRGPNIWNSLSQEQLAVRIRAWKFYGNFSK